ncbi:NAD(P)-binding protein [Coprinopsis marcescibilis]|uniref:NAD(P)-binding protein n=1 Tax=Coprinopsis marcescibilis TaxID=230819 RepID=A0A5C3KSI5_COPMA|nr:NAD(P)-binding protein [Coprinopsis marcescibilis]
MKSNHSSRNASPLRPAFSGVASFKVENLSIGDDMHPVIHAGRVAVITGAASGIGRAAAREFASLGLKVAIADKNEQELEALGKKLVEQVGEGNVLVVPTDVSNLEQVVSLRDKVYDAWGEVSSFTTSMRGVPWIVQGMRYLDQRRLPLFISINRCQLSQVAVLLNNAGIGIKGTSWEGIDKWREIFDVNLFGVINVQQTFVPRMIHQENQAVIITTGSKQGITNPPGNPAYNASKAAIKSLTESLAYELRERPHNNVTAHLFIPGWTFTGLTGANGAGAEKPRGAWTAEDTVLYMLDKVREGDFYIVVPDNETKREVDQLRIMWGAADIAENRPALSRWHPSYKSLFEEYMREGLAQLE